MGRKGAPRARILTSLPVLYVHPQEATLKQLQRQLSCRTGELDGADILRAADNPTAFDGKSLLYLVAGYGGLSAGAKPCSLTCPQHGQRKAPWSAVRA